jgi:hypothetical protein
MNNRQILQLSLSQDASYNKGKLDFLLNNAVLRIPLHFMRIRI